jgi:hypothetical protein
MLAVRTWRTAMFRPPLLSQAVFRLAFTSRGDLENPTDVGTFYIGLGDQFDDDRRLVRQRSAQLYVPFRPAYRSDRKSRG